MFSKDLALGAKALLVYHVDLLKDESPLPTLRYLKLGVYLSCVLTAKIKAVYSSITSSYARNASQKIIKQNKRTVAMYTHVHLYFL